ncbi:MAG TPA: hypothetical protein VIZ90_20255, partial [Rhizobiaceae bacterium]
AACVTMPISICSDSSKRPERIQEMLRMVTASLLVGAMAWSSSAWAASTAPAEVLTAGTQKILADANGRSLYTFDKDQPGKSECTLLCAVAWPPLIAPKDASASGHWSLVRRWDGDMQWAYKGSPLYTYRHDRNPGDVTGDGAEGVWHVAKP